MEVGLRIEGSGGGFGTVSLLDPHAHVAAPVRLCCTSWSCHPTPRASITNTHARARAAKLHGAGADRSESWWKGLGGLLAAEGLLAYHAVNDFQVVRVSEAGE